MQTNYQWSLDHPNAKGLVVLFKRMLVYIAYFILKMEAENDGQTRIPLVLNTNIPDSTTGLSLINVIKRSQN